MQILFGTHRCARLLTGILLSATGWSGHILRPDSAQAQGLPEPSLIFYGTLRNSAANNSRVTSGTLTWQIRKPSTGRIITLSTIASNYPGFSFVLEVPAETIIGGTVSS